ncbi:hypothetical protein [Sphingopyxis sp. SCN 67-31]|uniref:hypothetical protein n=1 Tax=Sphingopyxis sp. SCN 67-31 TaxID=1660142 RepID=UPI00086A224A|nr:hypothetical protein [Sphingopyxis sp. SCN 67-31]ODU36621.1 MAG: hypothetical protein ABS88_00070 [Sphingopyxis sp. SCN 67-31]
MARRKRTADRPGKIRYFDYWEQADGTIRYRWIASPRLRRLGWQSIDLGTDKAAAMTMAIARNETVAAADEARKLSVMGINGAAPPARKLPRRMTLADLIHEFRIVMMQRHALDEAHEEHLTKKTVDQYNSQMNWLGAWGGTTFLDEISVEVCKDLRTLLVNGASAWNTAARLRMLRQLLGFAASKTRGWIRENPMDGEEVTIPTPKSRTKRASIEAIEWLADFARSFRGKDRTGVERLGGANLELAVLLGFYSTQREGDLLAATRMNWRPIEDIDDYDRATLTLGGNGVVYGLRIFQQKTRKWVTCFLPPHVAERLDALIDSRGAGWDGPLLQNDDPDSKRRHIPDHEFQRIYRAMRDGAEAKARADGDAWLADELHKLQYRDMRRSGMCWMRDMGSTVPQIASISGHKIEYTMKILDTYMPGDPRASAAGLASALRTRAARPKKEKKG